MLFLWPPIASHCLPYSSASYHLRPAGSAGLPGQPLGPPNRTKEPVNISVMGGSWGARITLPWSRLLFQVALAVSAARLFSFLPLPVSYRIVSCHACLLQRRDTLPSSCPAGPTYTCC